MDITLLTKLSEKIKSRFSLILPNAKEMEFGEQFDNTPFQIVCNNEKGLTAIKSGDELKISEAYISGDIDLDGNIDMLKILEITRYFSQKYPFVIRWSRIISFFSNQIVINIKSIAQHYEYDNDFYLMFLDKTRTYSQGLFLDDRDSLEQSALRKLDFALQSCHLRPGDKVLDIGAGWGNLVEFLGSKGIHVDAVTLSQQSENFIAKLIADKKLAHCRVLREDFLKFETAPGETYDALFSLGTLEHLPDYKRMLKKCADLLKPGGYAYFDASAKIAGARGSYFIERHIFPGNHELLDIYSFIAATKKSPFELIFLNNDRHSYYLTLMHWAKNLDKHKDEIIVRWGKSLYRKFQLYFWGCCFGMLNNEIQAYRVVLRKRS